jgi:uncharacterized delta-60 repeat protein
MMARLHCGGWLVGAVLLGSCGTAKGIGTSGGEDTETDASTGSTTDDESTSTTTDDGSTTTTTSMSSTTNSPPECGNGVTEPPEECDDGNDVSGDGCEPDCTLSTDTMLWELVVAGEAGVVDRGHGITTDAEGNIYVIGFIVDTVGDSNVWVRKLDPGGDGVWTSILDPSVGNDDRGYGIAIDGDGNLAITGSTAPDDIETDIYLAKLDTNGAPLWSRSVTGPQAGVDGGFDVAVDPEGNFVFVGYVRTGQNDNDIWIQKTDTDGNALWTQTAAGNDNLDDRAHGVAIDVDGNIYVTGFVSNVGFNKDVWLRKLDPDGDPLWTTVHDSINSGSEEAFDVALGPDGAVAVVGTTPITASNDDIWLGRFDADSGDLLWQRIYGGPAIAHDAGQGVGIDSESNYVVVGYKGQGSLDTDIWLRKWDQLGSIVWTQNVAGAGMHRDEGVAVAIDADDNIVVTGEIRNSPSTDGDLWIAKFAP